MIPKIIHYCWYGQNEIPEDIKYYIDIWKKYCPDYKIICWNENNTNLNENKYLKQAYDAKKYAFVTDYMRLKVLSEYGGIYMDTDIELCKSLDEYLHHRAFIGCQDENVFSTGLIGAEANHPWIAKLFNHYNDLEFINNDGTYNLTPNTILITEITEKLYNWKFKNELQHLNDDICVYPVEYFCCKNWITGKVEKSSETVAIHHYKGSWLSEEDKRRSKYHLMKKNLIIKLIGKNNLEKAKSLRNKLLNKV